SSLRRLPHHPLLPKKSWHGERHRALGTPDLGIESKFSFCVRRIRIEAPLASRDVQTVEAQPTCFLSGAFNAHKDRAEPGHEVSAPTKADDEGKNVGMGAALCSQSAPCKT